MRRDTGPVHTWLLALVLVLLVSRQPQAAAPLPRITLRQRQGEHRVFVDPDGRERIFHGSSAVVKGPPWVPDRDTFSSDISMAREDFEWMQSLGLNVLRLGVSGLGSSRLGRGTPLAVAW